MGKKKKEPKIEQVFENSDAKPEEQAEQQSQDENQEAGSSDVDEFLGTQEESPENKLTEKQKEKQEKLNTVKSKISKILQSSNIEIVDENFDDEYEHDSGEAGGDGQSQEDYDSLKALFGEKDKNKKQELTLTIDDFDYSYVGQYLEEYDLMHMKNIKKVRIQKKHSPKLKKLIIAACLVIFIGVGAFLGYFYFLREEPVYLKNVTLNQTERNYYIDDIFDYSGLYFIAEYSDGNKKTINLDDSYFNFDASTGGKIKPVTEESPDIEFVSTGKQNLIFSYEGFDVEYVVNVLKQTEIGISAIYNDSIFNIKSGDIVDDDILKILVDYDDYGKEFIDKSNYKNYRLEISSPNEIFETKTYEYDTVVGGFVIDIDISSYTSNDEATIKIISKSQSSHYVVLLRGQNLA